MTNYKRPRNRDGFKIAIICALTRERDAVMEMLDESWKAAEYKKAAGDTNTYRLGRIGPHNVVVAQLPGMGTEAAASTSASFRSSFPGIILGLVVGICGGVPTTTDSGDILMGDVILSDKIIDHTFGRQYDNKLKIKDTLADSYGRPNKEIRAFLKTMEGKRDRAQLRDDSLKFLTELCKREGFESSQFPGIEKDVVYSRNYRHKHQQPVSCDECAECKAAEDELEKNKATGKAGDRISRLESKVKTAHVCAKSEKMSCKDLKCDEKNTAPRKSSVRALQSIEGTLMRVPQIHFGTIGSGNSVMKSGHYRDELANERDIIAFEMEGAGVWDNFPTVVIKAVCDYADGHKNKIWQDFAAASAAACMKAFLMEWTAVDDASQGVPEANTSINEHFLVPRRRVKEFFGREDELSKIASYFDEEIDRSRIVVLHAMGGQGKSQIALEYCQSSRKTYKGVFWVNSSSTSTITQSLVSIAQEFDKSAAAALPDDDSRVAFALRILEHWDHRWLMVFDNCDDATTFSEVEQFIPQVGKGNILFTSRHRDLAELGDIIEVPPMPQKAGIALLLHRYRGISVDDYTSEANVIVERLGNLALAIDQASAYIQYVRLPISKLSTFLPQYLAQREKVLQHTSRNFWKYTKISNSNERETAISAFTTWEMSFEQLLDNWEKRDSVAHFLTLSAFLAPIPVNESVFAFHWVLRTPSPSWTTIFTVPSKRATNKGFSDDPEQNTAARDNVMSDLSQTVEQVNDAEESWSSDQFWNLIYQGFQMSLLQSISPATDSSEANFLLHPLIRDWLQLRLFSEERQKYTREAVDVIVSSIQSTRDSDAQVKLTVLLHMDGMLASDNEFFGEEHRLGRAISTCDNAHWFASFYQEQGRYNASFSLHSTEVATRKRVLGKEHPDTLTSMDNLAGVLSDQGNYAEAEQMYRMVVEVTKRVLGEEHPSTLTNMDNLVTVLSDQGKYAEAEQMYLTVVEVTKRVLGEEHPDTLASMNNLATVLSDQGKYAEAEQMYLTVVEVRKRVLGEEYPSTLTSMNNLATVLSDQSKYAEAEQIHRMVVEVTKRVLGEEHPSILTSMNNLATVLSDQGKYAEAEQMYLTVVEVRKRVLGEEHLLKCQDRILNPDQSGTTDSTCETPEHFPYHCNLT